MSRKPKNNHYRYAEKFSDRANRSRVRPLVLPKRFLFLAVMLVLIFAVITVTFSVTDLSGESSTGGSIMISVRNARANRDDAVSGKPVNDLADTGAKKDVASVGATTYYYRGADNSWGATAMTASSDGFYAYIQSSNSSNQFKIALSTSGWDYNYTYVSKGFNSTDVSNIGDYSSNNCYCWQSGTYYIIVYYPNTLINTTNKPIICASTSLPNNTPTVQLGEYFTNSSTASYTTMTNNSGTYTVTKSFTGNLTRAYFLVVTYRSDIVHYYKNPDEGTMVYNNCTNWTFTNNNKADTKLTTVITGNYTFTFNLSGQKLSVTYPKYNVTVSKNPAAASSGSLTPSSATAVSIGSGITISAPAAADGYEWVNWTVTGGSVKTGSYTGTNMTSSTTRTNLTVYPYGTTQNVTLRANYKLSEYAITYKADASPATATAGTITNPATNSVPTGDKKTHGQSYTITSNKFTRSGYTQVGWSTTANRTNTTGNGYYAFGATYSTNAALTLYPVWQLNAPTKAAGNASAPEIISTGSMTIGSTPVALNLQVSTASVDATRTYTYSITGPSGHNASVGADANDSSTFMKFTADIPGTYSVYITVTDVSRTGVTNASNTASVNTSTATITVSPDTPDFTITGYNIVEDENRDGSTAEKACKILLGNRYFFSAEVDSTYLSNHPTSSYTYTWSTNADFAQEHIVGTGASITFTNTIVPNTNPKEYNVNLITYDPDNPPPPAADPRTLADESHGLENVTLYLRAACNGVSKDSSDKWLFYFIQPLIESFKYEPMQKIFNMNDQTVSLAAEYNIDNDPSYTTRLFFSHDNYNTTKAIETNGFIDSFFTAIKAFLYPSGPKYFYLEMEGYNSMHELITSVSDKIHTTVGTSDSNASRTLYFDNNTGVDLKNYLVMCYYIDGNGNLRYQTAQDQNIGDVNNEGLHYRVMIPQNATAVRFGFLARDIDRVRYYGSLSVTNGEIGGFTVPIYYGYTDQVALTGAVRRITATASTDEGSLKCFTCSGGAL